MSRPSAANRDRDNAPAVAGTRGQVLRVGGGSTQMPAYQEYWPLGGKSLTESVTVIRLMNFTLL